MALFPRSKLSLFAEFVLGPNPAQTNPAAPPPPREGRARARPRLGIFYTILNWGIKIYSALDYCAPEKLWVTEANGQLDSQRPLLSGVLGSPLSGSGAGGGDHELPSQPFQLPQAAHQPHPRQDTHREAGTHCSPAGPSESWSGPTNATQAPPPPLPPHLHKWACICAHQPQELKTEFPNLVTGLG